MLESFFRVYGVSVAFPSLWDGIRCCHVLSKRQQYLLCEAEISALSVGAGILHAQLSGQNLRGKVAKICQF